MTISLVGTPKVASESSAGSGLTFTAAWNTDQPRTAGDLLVAVLAYSGSATSPVPAAPSGWALQVAEDNSFTHVGIYTATAAGADAAWAAVVTFGTGGAAVCQYELSRASTAAPVDVTGTGTATASPVSVSSSAPVAAAGEFAVAGYAAYAATGATNTFTETGTGWTLDGDAALGTNRSHDDFSHSASPSAGSVTTGVGNFTYSPTSLAAAMVVFALAGSGTPVSGSDAAAGAEGGPVIRGFPATARQWIYV